MTATSVHERIAAALAMASDTRALKIGPGALAETAGVFQTCFGEQPALVIADVNTFAAAGQRVIEVLTRAGRKVIEPFLFDEPELHAHDRHVQRLEQVLASHEAVPIAVGSGTINDLTKLAAHRCGRPYMVVATAASMDGYTAYGASITCQGSKETFFCPAPRAVVADLDIISAAPPELNAAGYGDLIAKTAAGADWLLAGGLGIEPIDHRAWSLVQDRLREWTAAPARIRRGDPEAIQGLIEGLLMTGFAMQWCKSSRPASGAEHQFSHLWDMQEHHHHGRIPLHGCKVAIGTLAVTRLYEQLIEQPLLDLDIETVVRDWPGLDAIERLASEMHGREELRAVARRELAAKHVTRDQLRERLTRLKEVWPALRQQLATQLIPSAELAAMLGEAGAPVEPGDIGITTERLRRSYLEAQQIRRRYTVLDLAAETATLPGCLDGLFARGGVWEA